MKILGNILAIITALALLGVVVWGGYLGMRFVVIQFGLIDAREMPILVVASVVFMAGSVVIAAAIRSASMRNDKQVHPDKAFLYNSIVKILTGTEADAAGLEYELSGWLPQMQLWAGDEVLKQYMRLRNRLQQSDHTDDELKKLSGLLLLEIRRDFGHRNRGITKDWLAGQE